jgi:general stress protein 26
MQRLETILAQFRVGMLVTHAEDASMHARPMRIAAQEKDGVLWFLSDVESQKIIELGGDARATVVFQDPERARFLSLNGFAGATTERTRIEALWDDAFLAWFNAGAADPNLCAIYFEPTEAEYWDHSSFEAIRLDGPVTQRPTERSIEWNH